MNRAVIVLLLSSAAPALAGPQDPALMITWQVDEGEPIVVDPLGIHDPVDDSWTYSGTLFDSGTGAVLSYSLQADISLAEMGAFAAAAGTQISLNVAVTNPVLTVTAQRITIAVQSPPLSGGVVAQGSLNAGATCDAGGGSIGTLPGSALWTGLIDSQVAFEFFPYPWSLPCSCDLTCKPWGNFGFPVPAPAPRVQSTAGVRLEFDLTQGDQASVTGAFRLATLLGDLDHDRWVGVTDLLALLSQWGGCACKADLNGDGSVGGADLAMLLDNWIP